MESDKESYRLDIKTDLKKVENQAQRAGIEPGMRVADPGCGSGKPTAILHGLSLPGGRAVGIDYSTERLSYATAHYKEQDLSGLSPKKWTLPLYQEKLLHECIN